MKRSWLRALRATCLGSLGLTCASVVGSGCLDRPVAPATPQVTARVVEEVKQNKVSKIDLLFMIDNSSSMADKQEILADAVPNLVQRLIEPKCVDKDTGEVVGNPVNNQCANGILDFEPIKDIHIGIISSSLGGHGANGICDDGAEDKDRLFPHNNDRAHLLSRTDMDGVVPTFNSKGFLLFNPAPDSGGLKTAAEVEMPFRSMVRGVGQHGCGYEASLESVYRFLIDPEPYLKITRDVTIGEPGEAVISGIDDELLAQRAAFLRPDSLLSVMIVTDENDCSIIDDRQGFYPLVNVKGINNPGSIMPRSTAACLVNPNDRCCFSCGSQQPPSGCTLPANDTECAKDKVEQRSGLEDPANLRCFNQKQKYGQSFLYPVQRYIDGFTKEKIRARSGKEYDNPLFSDLGCKPGQNCRGQRDSSLVLVAGITGVPWQLIAKDPQNIGAGYKTAAEIDKDNIWLDIIGDPDRPEGPIPPRDPHMIESVTPRAGLAGTGSAVDADKFHGHEWDISKANPPSADLQYACTFALPAPRPCEGKRMDCDCSGPQEELDGSRNPLCQNGTAFTTQQRRAKAYPGTRILQVLRGIKPEQAIVASICPAFVDESMKNTNVYGYTPAIQALLSRLRVLLRGRCLPRPLEIDPADGTVKCVVVESFDSGGKCDCRKIPGRVPADEKVVTDRIREKGDCYCEIEQLVGDQQTQCKTNPAGATGNGWCYVDPSHDKDGNPDPRQCGAVSKCQPTERRLIKFANTASEPIAGATAFIMCQELAYDQTAASNAGANVCGN